MSNAWVIYLRIGDNIAKAMLIPDDISESYDFLSKVTSTSKLLFEDEPAYH